MKELTTALNLDEEVDNLVQFISQKWTPIANLRDVLLDVRSAAFHSARGWFDHYQLGDTLEALSDKRQLCLKDPRDGEQVAGSEYFDGILTLLSSMDMAARKVSDAGVALDGEWNYEHRVTALEHRLYGQYPGLAHAQPLGMATLDKAYCVQQAIDDYLPAMDLNEFNGVQVSGTLSPEFPVRVSLPYVMFDVSRSGGIASSVLVGAVFAHFLCIAKFLNTEKLSEDLATAFPDLDAPHIVFERRVQTENPFITVLASLVTPCPTQAEYDNYLVEVAEYEKLTPDEKEKADAASMAEMDEYIDQLTKLNPEEERREAMAEKQQHITLLLEALKA